LMIYHLLNWFIQALGEGTIILSDEKAEEIYRDLVNDFPFVEWGRIDWSKVDEKLFINNLDEIYHSVSEFITIDNQEVFILWGYGDSPVIQTTLVKDLSNIEEVMEVGSDQWIYALDRSFVIEFYHEGEIMIGLNK
jgi:hypothetical protein